jgi:hypothetical protein
MAYNERKKKVANAVSVKEMTYFADPTLEKRFSLMETRGQEKSIFGNRKLKNGISRQDVWARQCFLS